MDPNTPSGRGFISCVIMSPVKLSSGDNSYTHPVSLTTLGITPGVL